jgi:hypothetical protein
MSLIERIGKSAPALNTAGLGILAVPSIDSAQAHIRAGLAKDYNQEGVEKRTLLPHAVKPATEIGGLGVLALPEIAHLMGKRAMSPGLFNELKTTAGAGAKLNLGALTRGPVLKSETGALQSAARKGLGGFNTMPPPPRAAPIVGHIERDPFAMPKAAMVGFFDELAKLGAVSDDEARRSLDRLDALERNKPTLGQTARNGALASGAGVLGHVIGRAIEGGANKPTARSMLGSAASGALLAGGVPLVRTALDQRAEKGTLKRYLHQGDFAPNQGAATDVGTPTGLSR